MPIYYIVFSPKEEFYQEVEDIVADESSSFKGKYILVKEYGKKGNHPHLNLVYNDKVSKAHINRKWTNIFNNHNLQINLQNHKLIYCTTAFNLDKLVQGYLSKESKSQVLNSRYYVRNVDDPETIALRKESKLLHKKIVDLCSDFRMLCNADRPARFDLQREVERLEREMNEVNLT